jgi:thiol-disulfide isomerase/thioredoxin
MTTHVYDSSFGRLPPMRRTVFTLFALLALTACAGPQSAPSQTLGQPVSLTLPSDDGQLFVLEEQRGTVVLDLWAPSCVPCRESLPALVAREAELTDAGARLVLLGVLAGEDESTEEARAVLVSWGVDRGFLVDREGASQRAFGVRELPATVVVRNGAVEWVAPTGATADDVLAAVRR